MIDSGWYVLTIVMVATAFIAGWLLGDKPRYRDCLPTRERDWCPTWSERLYYQQWIKNRPLHESAAAGKEIEKFLEKMRP